MRLVVYYCINGDNTLLDDKLEAQEVVIVANKTRMSQSEFENAVGWDCLKQSYAKIDRILLEFGGCSYKVRCKHKFMNIRKWDDSTNKCVEEGTELVSCGDKKGFIAVPTCRKHKAVADRWIAANSDTEMSARIMRGQMNEEGQKSSAIAADMANIDALAQIKKNWLETGQVRTGVQWNDFSFRRENARYVSKPSSRFDAPICGDMDLSYAPDEIREGYAFIIVIDRKTHHQMSVLREMAATCARICGPNKST